MKKKYRLKRWVKVVLNAMLVMAILTIICVLSYKEYKKAVNDCVAGGNSREWCERVVS